MSSPQTVPTMPDAHQLKTPSRSHVRDLMRQARRAVKELQKFVAENPSQQLDLDGKKYPRVEAWQFLGACFGCTALITSTQEFRDEGDVPGFLAIAHVRNEGGQILTGAEAACMRNEPDWSEKPSFQLRSMAQTRAVAKAFRNIFAWVMVKAGFCPTPAEEMEFQRRDHPSAQPSPMTGKNCYECGNQLSDARYRQSVKKYGKPLCLLHEKAETQPAIPHLVNDPADVPEAIADVRGQGKKQPVAQILDAMPARKDVYGL